MTMTIEEAARALADAAEAVGISRALGIGRAPGLVYKQNGMAVEQVDKFFDAIVDLRAALAAPKPDMRKIQERAWKTANEIVGDGAAPDDIVAAIVTAHQEGRVAQRREDAASIEASHDAG